MQAAMTGPSHWHNQFHGGRADTRIYKNPLQPSTDTLPIESPLASNFFSLLARLKNYTDVCKMAQLFKYLKIHS